MKKNIIITFILIILVIVGMRFLFPNYWSRNVLSLGKVFSSIGARLDSISFDIKNKDNQALIKRIEQLDLQVNNMDILLKENKELKTTLGREDTRVLKLAIVLSKPTITPYDTFTIDQGSTDGIMIGNKVLAGSSTAIGLVSEIYPNFSKVTAFSSPSSKYPVYVGDTYTQAEAVGQGNGNYKIVLPEGSEVKIGDDVIVPGIVSTLFGVVEKIIPSDQPSFINVLFKAPVNLSDLYYVYITK